MPLPAANSSRFASKEDGVKMPAGASDSISSPAETESQIQFEPYPSTVRLTVTCNDESTCGELDSE